MSVARPIGSTLASGGRTVEARSRQWFDISRCFQAEFVTNGGSICETVAVRSIPFAMMIVLRHPPPSFFAP
jgi:hypothetical protein